MPAKISSSSIGLILFACLGVAGYDQVADQQKREALAARDAALQRSFEHQARGESAQSLAAATEAVERESKALGQALDPASQTWEQLVRLLVDQEEWAKAESFLQELRVVRTRALGESHWLVKDVERVQNALRTVRAWDERSRKDLREARKASARLRLLLGENKIEQASALAGELVGTNVNLWGEAHAESGLALFNRGIVAVRANENERAKSFFEKAQPILEAALGEHPLCARCLYQRALVAVAAEDLHAIEMFEMARKRFDKLFGREHADYIDCLVRLGIWYGSAKQIQQAEQVTRESLDLTEKVYGPDSRAAAERRRTLGSMLASKKDYQGAKLLLEQAEQFYLRNGGKNQPGYLWTNEEIAGLAIQQSDLETAEKRLREDVEISKSLFGNRSAWHARALRNLGKVLAEKNGGLREAATLFRQASELFWILQGTKSFDYFFCTYNLARTLDRSDDFANAKSAWKAAADAAESAPGVSHSARITSLMNFAFDCRNLNEDAESERAFLVALKAAEKGDPVDEDAVGRIYENLGLTLRLRALLDGKHPELFQTSRRYYESAIEHYLKASKEPTAAWAWASSQLGNACLSCGDFRSAEQNLTKAIAFFEPVKKQYAQQHLSTLVSLGLLESNRGRHAESLKYNLMVVALEKESYAATDPRRLQHLRNVSGAQMALRDYRAAERTFRDVLAIVRSAFGEASPEFAAALNEVAFSQQGQGLLSAAKATRQQALAIFREKPGVNTTVYALALAEIADIECSLGDIDTAEKHLLNGIAIVRGLLGDRDIEMAGMLNKLGHLRSAQGNTRDARESLEQALAIERDVWGADDTRYLSLSAFLAANYNSWGDHAAARRVYEEVAASRLRKEGPSQEYGEALALLGHVLVNLREFQKAEEALLESLRIAKQVHGETHQSYAEGLSGLASLYHSKRDYQKARQYYEDALAVWKRIGGDNYLRHTLVKLLGDELILLGDFAGAEAAFTQSVAMCERLEGRNSPNYADSVAKLSEMLEDYALLGQDIPRLRRAQRGLADALDEVDRVRGEVFEREESKLMQGSKSADLVPKGIGVLHRLFSLEHKAADLDAAVTVFERGAARVFLEQLGRTRAADLGRIAPELRKQETGLRSRSRELANSIRAWQERPAAQRDTAAIAQLFDQQRQNEVEWLALIKRVEKESPRYAALRYPIPCSLAEARSCLAPNEVALLFAVGSEKSYVVVLQPKPPTDDNPFGAFIYELAGENELSNKVSSLTDSTTLATPRLARSLASSGFELVLGAVEDEIKGKDLLIVPSGPLCYLPFELLIENERYLIESHRIRYAPSLAALHMIQIWDKDRVKAKEPLWALGDPIYQTNETDQKSVVAAGARKGVDREISLHENRDESKGFKRLAFSGAEVRAIQSLLGVPASSLILGAAANEANVKALSKRGDLKRARYVHFATHGVLGSDDGLQPGLVLSLAGNSGQRDEDGGLDDGYLRLDEVTRLQLNADLVVLSACRTGQGRMHRGEGVTGLARAFLFAGSRGVVSSLWSVDDRETANFMTSFYGGLQNKQSAADALRAAKLKMIQDGKPPFYWAPFVLMGY